MTTGDPARRLAGRAILVVGAATGIGRATAERLALVNAVEPGTIRTRVWDGQGDPHRFAPLYPLQRIGEPADVAAAIAFLCSDDAAWITGHVLPVDGGLRVRRVVLGE